MDELGPIADAKAAWPEAFVPGNLVEASFGGTVFYAFAGEAEQFFSGKYAEPDSELYEEAVLDAKARLFESLSKGDPDASVSMSGLRTAYKFADGAFRRVVCVVPRDSVSRATSKDSATAASTGPAESPASAPPAPANAKCAAPAVEAKSANSSPGPEKAPLKLRIRKCRERIRESPDDYLLRRRMARLKAEGGKNAEAARCYESMALLLSKTDSLPDNDKASLLLEGAEYARDNGRPAQALKLYRLISKLGLPGYTQNASEEISLLLLRN